MNLGKESEYVEFKRSTSETKEALASMCAMLNKNKKGTVYFGVKDNGEVIGQEIGKDTLNQLSQSIGNHIKPRCLYAVEEKYSIDNKAFIQVTFSGERVPYSAYDRYYIRFADEDIIMDNDMLRDYYLSSNNDYSKWEKSDSGVNITSVDNELLHKYYQDAYDLGRIRHAYKDHKDLLNRLDLVYGDDLNNAGNVLFSSEGPVLFKLATFATTTRVTIIDSESFEGNVFECINKALDYIARRIDWHFEFDGSAKRKEVPEIPLEAIREIIVNAFSHGDYNSNTDFEVDIYKDRVDIYSPGHFPKPYSPEEFAQGKAVAIPMNNTITEVLYRGGIIEKLSTGFERTFTLCEKNKIEYSYEELNTGFRFTFYRKEFSRKKLSKSEAKVLEAIKNHDVNTVKEIEERTGLSRSTVLRSIASLKDKALIQRKGSDKKGTYSLL